MSAQDVIRDCLSEVGYAFPRRASELIFDALKAAGYGVVKVASPMRDRSNVAESLKDRPQWLAGDAWTCLLTDGLIEFEADRQQVYGQLSVSDARLLAAALLAAANAAEKQVAQ